MTCTEAAGQIRQEWRVLSIPLSHVYTSVDFCDFRLSAIVLGRVVLGWLHPACRHGTACAVSGTVRRLLPPPCHKNGCVRGAENVPPGPHAIDTVAQFHGQHSFITWDARQARTDPPRSQAPHHHDACSPLLLAQHATARRAGTRHHFAPVHQQSELQKAHYRTQMHSSLVVGWRLESKV